MLPERKLVAVDALREALSEWLGAAVALGFWLAMPVMAWQQYKRISMRKDLLAASDRGSGVVEKLGVAGEKAVRYRVVYTGPHGEEHRFWTASSTYPELGETVDVAYDPADPKRADVVANLPVQRRDWGGFIVFIGATTVGLFFALLWLFTETL